MRKIREVLRLRHECGCQHRQIALACEMSPSTVGDYLGRAERAGLTWEQAKPLSDAEVEARLATWRRKLDDNMTKLKALPISDERVAVVSDGLALRSEQTVHSLTRSVLSSS